MSGQFNQSFFLCLSNTALFIARFHRDFTKGVAVIFVLIYLFCLYIAEVTEENAGILTFPNSFS